METINQIQNKYKKIVFVVIFRKTQDNIFYLILKRKLGWKGWEFPKCEIKNDESAIKSIKREVKEETGQVPYYIKKYSINGKFVYEKQTDSKSEFVGSKYGLYSAKVKENQIKISSREHSDYKWADLKTAIRYLEWENQRDSLKIVNKKLEELFHFKSTKQIPLKKKKFKKKEIVRRKTSKRKNTRKKETSRIKTSKKPISRKNFCLGRIKNKFARKRKR